MTNETTIEQPEVSNQIEGNGTPPDKTRALYDKLYKTQLYTKSYDEFQKQYSNPESIGKLYQGLTDNQLYTKSKDEFTNQYFGAPKASALASAVRTKVSTAVLPTPENEAFQKEIERASQPVHYGGAVSDEEKQAAKNEAEIDRTGLTSLAKKAKQAQEDVFTGLHGNDQHYEQMVRESRADAYTLDNLKKDYHDKGYIIPIGKEQDFLKAEKKRHFDLPVTTEDVLDAKTGVILNEQGTRSFINRTGDKQLKANSYLVDAHNSAANDSEGHARAPVILKNKQKIEKGEYDYDPESGLLTKPEGFYQSMITANKQLNQGFKDYDFFTQTENKSAILSQLESDIHNPEPDKPISVPEGFGGHAGAMVGGTPPAGLLAGAIAGGGVSLLGEPEAAGQAAKLASAGVSAHDFYRLGYANALKQNYAAFRQQGLDPNEAYDKAEPLAKNQARADAVSAAAMGALGFESALKPVGSITKAFQTSIIKGLTQIGEFGAKKTLEGLGVGVTMATGQAIKNIMATEAGIPTDTLEGTGEQIQSGLMFTLGASLLAKATGLMRPKTRTEILQGLSKADDETLQKDFTKLAATGQITDEQASGLLKEVQEHRALDQAIPENVPELNRLKIQAKITERNILEEKIKSTDKAFHEDLKERVKKLNEDILELAKPEEKTENGKLIDKAIKGGKMPAVFEEVARNDPDGFLKAIADQSLGRDEKGTVIPGSEAEAEMRKTFGDDMVDKAKELYPLTQNTEEHASNVRENQGELPPRGEIAGNGEEIRSNDVQQIPEQPSGNAGSAEQAGIGTEGQGNVENKEVNVLSMLKESKNLSPEEKKILYRQYRKGVMSEEEIAKYTHVDVNDIKGGNADKWASVIMDKIKGQKISAEDIEFEEISQPEETQNNATGEKVETFDLPFSFDDGGTQPPIKQVPLAEGQPRHVTSIKNAITDEKRKQYGFSPAMEVARKELGVTWDEAMQKIEDGYNPADLVTDLKKKARPLTDTENAILLKHQIDKETEQRIVNDAINAAGEKGDEATLAENRIKKARIQDELNDIYDVGKAAGTENARGLNARKLMAYDDYSLASMVSKKRAANDGAALTADQMAELEQKHTEIQAKLKAYEARITELETQVKELQTKKPLKQKVETVVKNIRSLKINKGDKLQASFAAIPVAIWDGAIETVAKAVEGGAALADAIQQGIAHLKTNGHLQSKGEEENFINHIYVNAGEERPFANLLDKETVRLKADYERAKANFDADIYKDEQSKRSGFAKGADVFVKWERAGKLSWPTTLAKLASAGLTRLVTSPVEDVVGVGIGAVLPKEVTGKAHGEAGFNVKAQAKAFTEAFTTGMKDAYDTMSKGRLGKSDIDFAFGDRKLTLPPEIADFLGKLHGAIKAPIKRAIFEKSLEKRIANNTRMGNDITDPMVQTEIALQAYKDGQRAIFMQDNWASKKYQTFITMLENDKDWPTVSKTLASGMQFLIPFVKVPTNIVAETAALSGGGLVAGGMKLMHTAFTKGLKNLTVEESDMIMRNLKKGAVGSAALLVGFLNPTEFGGFYQEKEKRKEGDLKANQMRIFGTQLPSWLLHAPIFNAMQLGATIRRVKDKYMHEHKDDATLNGVMAGALGLIKEVPLAEQPIELGKLFDPQERNYYVGELAKNTIDPGIVQFAAKIEQGYNPWTEKTAHKPQPATILEHVETGIPGLTENVSTKKKHKK